MFTRGHLSCKNFYLTISTPVRSLVLGGVCNKIWNTRYGFCILEKHKQITVDSTGEHTIRRRLRRMRTEIGRSSAVFSAEDVIIIPPWASNRV